MAEIEQFTPQPDDPLTFEHTAVNRWIQDATRSSVPHEYWRDADLDSVESGRFLLETNPEQARRLLLAAVAQARHWDERIEQIRARAKSDMERINAHLDPNWQQIWTPRRHTVAAIRALLRRSLPLEKRDIVDLLTWSLSNSSEEVSSYLTKALQRYASANKLDPELRDLLREFAASLRSCYGKKARSLGTVVEQLCENAGAVPEQRSVIVKDPPTPSSAGCPLVLYDLKCLFGMAQAEPAPARIQVGPDRFQMPVASPLVNAHEKLTALLNEAVGSRNYHSPDLRELPAGRDILDFDPTLRGRMLLAAAERHMGALLFPTSDYNDTPLWQSRYSAAAIPEAFMRLPVQLDRDLLFDFLLYLSTRPQSHRIGGDTNQTSDALLSRVEEVTGNAVTLTEGERFVLHLWRGARILGPPLGVSSPDIEKMTRWIGDESPVLPGSRRVLERRRERRSRSPAYSGAFRMDRAAEACADGDVTSAIRAVAERCDPACERHRRGGSPSVAGTLVATRE